MSFFARIFNKNKLIIGSILVFAFSVCFTKGQIVNAATAGSQISKVTETFSSAIGVLQIEIEAGANVGEIGLSINNGDEIATIYKGGSKYVVSQKAKTNDNITLKAYNYDGNVVETMNYRLESTGKLTKLTPPTSVRVTGVALDKTALTLISGGTGYKLTATVTPSNATNKNVTWKSDKTTVATVDASGNVKPIAAGTAKITVTTQDQSKTATCTVTVTAKVDETGATLNQTKLTLVAGGTGYKLIPTIAPSNATNKNVTWKSSNTKVATVDTNGNVVPVGAGTATITVTTQGKLKTATCTVTVTAQIYETGVILNQTKLTLIAGGTGYKLISTIAPSNATNKNVTWKSSNTRVATVDASGNVVPVGTGTATITVTTQGKLKTATCIVTVNPKTVPVSSITMSLVLKVNSTVSFEAIIAPTDATNKEVVWSTSSSSIATVTSTGSVKAVKAGTAIITVKTKDGTKSASFIITVKN
jgi:uncharacterized protein YjdB